jgi:hypothetical protein
MTDTTAPTNSAETEWTYADIWRDRINETYEDALESVCTKTTFNKSGEAPELAIVEVFNKAADALRCGLPATFSGPELDIVRHLMPAHECHQSYAKRFVLEWLMDQGYSLEAARELASPASIGGQPTMNQPTMPEPADRFSEHCVTPYRSRKKPPVPSLSWYIQDVEDIAATIRDEDGFGIDIDRRRPLVAADLPDLLHPLDAWNCEGSQRVYDDAHVAADLAARLDAVLPRLHELQALLVARSVRAPGDGPATA